MSEVVAFDPKTLPKLTPKQMGFVRGVADGKTAVDAWLDSYEHRGDYSQEVAWVRASELSSNSKVVVWIDALNEAGWMDAKLTKEGHLRELASIKRKAINKEQFNVGLGAEIARGKAVGLYVEQREVSVTVKLDDELLERMRRPIPGDNAVVIEHEDESI